MREGQSISAIPEKESERILTPEEVRAVFEQLIDGAEYKDGRREEDESGLWLWNIIISGEDEEGIFTEYEYIREGRHGNDGKEQSSATAIHVILFDKEGIPAGGHSVAKYLEGEWMLAV